MTSRIGLAGAAIFLLMMVWAPGSVEAAMPNSQAQLVVVGGIPIDGHGGLVGVQANGTIGPFGLSLGLNGEFLKEDVQTSPEEGFAGSLDLAFQFRPLGLDTSAPTYPGKYSDVHLSAGAMLGAGGLGGDFIPRGALYLGAGIDVGFPAISSGISVQYRFVPVQTPDLAPAHMIVIGAGLRYAGGGG